MLKKIEEKRQAGLIGSSLEAKVTLASDDAKLKNILTGDKAMLRYLFIVSQANVAVTASAKASGQEPELPVTAYVEKADGAKCQRCWNYSVEVGKDSRHPTLCERCVAALKS